MRGGLGLALMFLFAACATTAPAPAPAPILQTVVVPQTVIATLVPAATNTSQPNATKTSTVAQSAPVASAIQYVAGSSHKVCQLTGETDRQLNQPTVNQTATRFGLLATDLGYSFEHDGKLFLLFGDSFTSPRFNGMPNLLRDPPRIADDNDAIAYSTDTSIAQCLHLDFIHYPNGAYKNPVVLDAEGQPAITLRAFEVPVAGISDGGKMYVLFATDALPPAAANQNQAHFSTRSVVAVSEDDANTFHSLYDFSKDKFINVAIGQGQDGSLYFWGTQGGTLYRSSAPFLARKPIGSMGSASGLEYLQKVNTDGTPRFTQDENGAAPLFHDVPSDCMGELGVEWNSFLKQWVMLYNCNNNTPANPRGVYLRVAAQPWGPWSTPQTIFNPAKDDGLCQFIHRAVNAQNPTPCDNVSDPNKEDVEGGDYGPYFLSPFTTGDAGSGTSTFYYTMSTWNPYGQVIMKSTIQLQTP